MSTLKTNEQGEEVEFDYKKLDHVVAYFALKEGGSINLGGDLTQLLLITHMLSIYRNDHNLFECLRILGMPCDNIPEQEERKVFIDRMIIVWLEKSSVWGDYLWTEPSSLVAAVSSNTKYDDLEELSDSDIDILEESYHGYKNGNMYVHLFHDVHDV